MQVQTIQHLPWDQELARGQRVGQNVRPRSCSTDRAKREHYMRARNMRFAIRMMGHAVVVKAAVGN